MTLSHKSSSVSAHLKNKIVNVSLKATHRLALFFLYLFRVAVLEMNYKWTMCSACQLNLIKQAFSLYINPIDPRRICCDFLQENNNRKMSQKISVENCFDCLISTIKSSRQCALLLKTEQNRTNRFDNYQKQFIFKRHLFLIVSHFRQLQKIFLFCFAGSLFVLLVLLNFNCSWFRSKRLR